ncbi:hypothetical protein [Rhodococcus sp. 21391]|uniref:hypothetical protein n=1 Tax=Rhodococcus sp. 21391 TaxID=2683591 RepID=UPI003080AD89
MQAREVESALVERGEWNGLTEFRHFVTGEPIPMLISTFVLQHTRTGPSLVASFAQDRRGAEEDEQRLHRALAESAYRARGSRRSQT